MGNTVTFGSCRLIRDQRCLLDGDRRIALSDKPFRALDLLVSRAGTVVSREELRWELWPDGEFVDYEHGINTILKRLRDALGEASSLIVTLPRRGYRFDGLVVEPDSARQSHVLLVGRETELTTLQKKFDLASQHVQQCVLVTGEAGIGKTTLIRRFAEEIGGQAYVAEVEAVATFGPGDPFGGVIDLLGRLISSYPSMRRVMAVHAPSWLAHVPGLRGAGQAPPAALPMVGSEGRMCREAIAALDALAMERTVVVVFEDLHWSDAPTITFIRALVHRHASSRLLVVCSWRTSGAHGGGEVVPSLHGLLREGAATSIPLPGLSIEAIRDYLHRTFDETQGLDGLAAALHSRTGGNPLFVAACLDACRGAGLSSIPPVSIQGRLESALPAALQEIISERLASFPPGDQRLLQAASLLGPSFTAGQLLAAVGDDPSVPARLRQMSRACDVIRSESTWMGPASPSDEFAFVHALYHEALEQSLPPTVAATLHGRIADLLQVESGHEADPRRVATLAWHFEKSGQLAPAARARSDAAAVALARSAFGDAVAHATQGLRLLEHLPPGPARDGDELALQLRLGAAVSWTHGFWDRRAVQAFDRALALSSQLPDQPDLVPALLGINRYYGSCGPITHAIDAARRAWRVAAESGMDQTIRIEVLQHLATVENFAGEQAHAEKHIDDALELLREHEAVGPGLTLYLTGLRASAICRIARAYIKWYRGDFGASRRTATELVEMLPTMDHVDSLCCTLAWLAVLESFDDSPDAIAHARLALERERPRDESINYRPFAQVGLGRAEGRGGDRGAGRALIEQALPELACSWRPIAHASLADLWLLDGSPEQALRVADGALAETLQTGIRYFDAELLRLRGAAIALDGSSRYDEAVQALGEAAMLADRQAAKWLALRVAATRRQLNSAS